MHFTTRAWPSRISAALALTAALAAPAAHAGFFDDLFGGKESTQLERWAASPDDTMKWGEWDFLRIDTRGAQAQPSAHPVQLSADQVATALSGIKIQGFKQTNILFSEDEIRRFAPAIAIGLAKANAYQDLIFVSTGQHSWSGLMAPLLANSGRIFFADGRLNLILGSAHIDFLADLRQGSRQPPRFDFGSRGTRTPKINILGVEKGEAKIIREDWIAISIANVAAPATVPVTTANPIDRNRISPVQQPQPVAQPAPQAAPVEDPFYGKQEARLRALKRMRDQGLITDEEFQQKRADVLKNL
ncbi:SHOCT domain-containing protein [Niveibacterium terrae]|uniref:SHOCT domain-containing protein n=1 Tax=Niveibacterium terrae TaxID=3373598 RepID=UPI003A9412A0